MNLDHLQVHGKWEMSDMRAAVLAATEDGKRWAEFHFNESNCHPTDKGHVVWAESAFKSIQESMTRERP